MMSPLRLHRGAGPRGEGEVSIVEMVFTRLREYLRGESDLMAGKS